MDNNLAPNFGGDAFDPQDRKPDIFADDDCWLNAKDDNFTTANVLVRV